MLASHGDGCHGLVATQLEKIDLFKIIESFGGKLRNQVDFEIPTRLS